MKWRKNVKGSFLSSFLISNRLVIVLIKFFARLWEIEKMLVISKYVSGSGISFQKFSTETVRERVNQRIHCDIKNLSQKVSLELYVCFFLWFLPSMMTIDSLVGWMFIKMADLSDMATCRTDCCRLCRSWLWRQVAGIQKSAALAFRGVRFVQP